MPLKPRQAAPPLTGTIGASEASAGSHNTHISGLEVVQCKHPVHLTRGLRKSISDVPRASMRRTGFGEARLSAQLIVVPVP
jgi:hypothetical protein